MVRAFQAEFPGRPAEYRSAVGNMAVVADIGRIHCNIVVLLDRIDGNDVPHQRLFPSGCIESPGGVFFERVQDTFDGRWPRLRC